MNGKSENNVTEREPLPAGTAPSSTFSSIEPFS